MNRAESRSGRKTAAIPDAAIKAVFQLAAKPVTLFSLVTLIVGAAPRIARADQTTDDSNAAGQAIDAADWVGPVAGAMTALVPLALGGALLAHDSRPDLQRDGTYVILSGFAAAPWVSHAITRRWRRGLVFGLASLGTAAATFAAMRVQDPFDPDIANHDRLTFGFLLTSTFFAAAVGVADSFIFGSRPRVTSAVVPEGPR